MKKRGILVTIIGILAAIFIGLGISNQPDSVQNIQSENNSQTTSIESSEQQQETETESSDESISESESTDEEVETDTSEKVSSSERESSDESETTNTDQQTNESEPSEKKNSQAESNANSGSNNSKSSTSNQTETTTTSQATNNPPAPEPVEQVYVTIDFSAVGQGSMSFATNYQEGMTAMDATINALQSAGLSYSVVGSGASAYMEGINGLFEFDEGPMSGWLVNVDGVHISVGAGAYDVGPNSQVTWHYTTDFTQ